MPSATLTSKGQITLPKAIRQRLRVHTGDAVEFTIGADGKFAFVPEAWMCLRYEACCTGLGGVRLLSSA